MRRGGGCFGIVHPPWVHLTVRDNSHKISNLVKKNNERIPNNSISYSHLKSKKSKMIHFPLRFWLSPVFSRPFSVGSSFAAMVKMKFVFIFRFAIKAHVYPCLCFFRDLCPFWRDNHSTFFRPLIAFRPFQFGRLGSAPLFAFFHIFLVANHFKIWIPGPQETRWFRHWRPVGRGPSDPPVPAPGSGLGGERLVQLIRGKMRGRDFGLKLRPTTRMGTGLVVCGLRGGGIVWDWSSKKKRTDNMVGAGLSWCRAGGRISTSCDENE